MNKTSTDSVPILQGLIRCRSVTPAEGGALTYLEDLLSEQGFVCQRLIFREEGTPDVENLFASRITSYNVCYTKLLRIR